MKLHWNKIPYEGELTLGMTLDARLNARLEAGHEKMAAATEAMHVFGVPRGACPPGARRATSEGWIANDPPPPPPLPSSPPPPLPPPPTVDGDAEMDSLDLYVQPAGLSIHTTRFRAQP